MSRRQEERAERIYAFWAPRFAGTFGRDKAELAFKYLTARIHDLPKKERARAFEAVADEMVALADKVTAGDLHISHSHQAGTVPETLRAQARRAGARGTA